MGHIFDFNDLKHVKLINDVLAGAVLDEYIFNTSFTLVFVQTYSSIDGIQIPYRLSLRILSEWWFGEKDEWIKFVHKFTIGMDYVEPDEPVLAYRLTALRWNSNAKISSVFISREYLRIVFDNKEFITISNYSIEDNSWEMWDEQSLYTEVTKRIYFICEEGNVFFNIP